MDDSTHSRGRTRGLGRAALILFAYCLVTAVVAGPFIDYRHLASTCYNGDAHLTVWTLAWDSHAVLHGLPLFGANIFYPAANALAYNEHLFAIAIFYLPIYALTSNPILAYNLLWLAAWILNASAACLLARRYVADDLGAFIGGLVFAFSFFRMHHFAHLGLAWTFWMPLALVAIEWWYRRPTWPRVALLSAVLVLQVLACWYLAVFVLIAAGLWLTCLALFDDRRKSGDAAARAPWWKSTAARRSMQLAVAVAIACVMVWPFARHYRAMAPVEPREAASNSADLAAFFVPPLYTWSGRILESQAWAPKPRWLWGERTLFLGFVALGLSVIGAASLLLPGGRRRWPSIGRPARLFLPLLAVVAFAPSLGPSLPPHGSGWMPFDWFSRLPGAGGLRAPARFTLLILLAMSVFAALGATAVHRRYGWRGRVATLLLVPLMLSEWYVVGFGPPTPDPIPPIYRRLAHLPGRAVVSLPIYRGPEWYRELDYVYYSTAHWHPVVNGGGRSEPDDYFRVVSHMMAFAGPNSARTMRRLGVDYVVVHADRSPVAAGMVREALETEQGHADFRLLAREGNDYLFEVLPK